MKIKKAQNLLEYTLIGMIVAMAGYLFVSKIDMSKLKSYVFGSPQAKNSSQITIEAMTK